MTGRLIEVKRWIVVALWAIWVLPVSAQTIQVVYTTDVHGALFPYNFITQSPRKGSLAVVSRYLKELRASQPNVILLDNGDIYQGDPAVYYYNYVDTALQHILPLMMNALGYSGMVVGNHDLETGHPVYDRARAQSNFPWLAANVMQPDGSTYFEPYRVFEIEGKRIAVLGLITPAIPLWLPQALWHGMEFDDMVQSARHWVNVIRQKEHPDVLIGIFHAGIDYEYNFQTAQSPKNENAVRLVADQVKGFDAILFGHDHKLLNIKERMQTGDSVILLNAGSGARSVGQLTIRFDVHSKPHLTAELVDLEQMAADEEFMHTFSQSYQKVNDYALREIGVLERDLDAEDAFFGSSAYVDISHRVMLEYSGADISFSAPLSFRGRLKAGPITVGKMFTLYKYENLLYCLKMTGKEVKNYLEFSYNLWVQNPLEGTGGLLRRNSEGKLEHAYYNFDSAAGIHYTVDVTKPMGQRITIIALANGTPFDPNKLYRVALNSYRGNGGGGHLGQGAGIGEEELARRLEKVFDHDLRYLMMKTIEENGRLNAQPLNNWQFVPVDVVKQAINKEAEIQ